MLLTNLKTLAKEGTDFKSVSRFQVMLVDSSVYNLQLKKDKYMRERTRREPRSGASRRGGAGSNAKLGWTRSLVFLEL